MKNLWWTLGLASTLALCLAACSDNNTETGAVPDTVTAPDQDADLTDTLADSQPGTDDDALASPDIDPSDTARTDSALPDTVETDPPDTDSPDTFETDPPDTDSPDTLADSTTPDDVGPEDVVEPHDYENEWHIGPDQDYETPSDAPWEDLQPNTAVYIHHRPEPYTNKWVINVAATEDEPVLVTGVPGDNGELPVISGDGATTRQALDFWNEERSVIKIGGSSTPADGIPSWITVANLEIRSAHPIYGFTDDKGSAATYADNAAAITIEKGHHLTIEGCVIHDNANGLFSGPQAEAITLRANHIYGNGVVGSFYQHNTYMASKGILYEENRYGPLRDGATGNNLKDRSASMVIRYNWVEGGNRQLDLVETSSYANGGAEGYGQDFVYGNVLIEPDGAGNSQIVHWGGDTGDETTFRPGTLHFFHNTVVSYRQNTTTLLRLSSNAQSADLRNNLVHVTAAGTNLAISEGMGTITMTGNWLTFGAQDTHGTLTGDITTIQGYGGPDPEFADASSDDVTPKVGKDQAEPLADAAAGHPVLRQYVPHQGSKLRATVSTPDIGAMEQGEPPKLTSDQLLDGPWLMGWHGGLDHFSWLIFDDDGTYALVDPGSDQGALVFWLGCTGVGTWSAEDDDGVVLTLNLPDGCETPDSPLQFKLGTVYDSVPWPEPPVLSVATSPTVPDTYTHPQSAYLYPSDWCTGPPWTCGFPWNFE